MSTQNPRRVLHVTEGFGGGLADAITSYVSGTPQFEHHLLYALRDGIIIPRGTLDHFASATPMVAGTAKRVRQVRRIVEATSPDIVHAHSSYAGVYVRVALAARRVPITYSPHCFPFERRDVSLVMRVVYRFTEFVLARNTTMFIVCSPREVHLVEQLSHRASVRYVTNVARVGTPTPGEKHPGFTVVGIGRVVAQKGTQHFAHAARQARESGRALRFLWLGGGETDLRDELLAAGVEVTGWLPKHDVLASVASADAYLHTAEWEGFPIGLLEAVALEVPSLVLDKPYAQGLPEEMLVHDDDIGERLIALSESAPARESLLVTGRTAFASFTQEVQGAQLAEAYDDTLTGKGLASRVRSS